MKWLTRRLCLFYMWNWLSSPLWWMSVAWVWPNCRSAQQRVVILSWPLAQDTHSNSGPLVQSTKTMQSCRASSTTVGQSPGGGLFYDMSLPNLIPALNGFFVISSMWMSARLCCGSMDSLCSDTLHGFHQDLDSTLCLPLDHNRSPFILQPLFSYPMKLIF